MNKTFAIIGTGALTPLAESHCPPLVNALLDLGYKEAPSSQADFLIAINHDKESYEKFRKQGGTIERAALIRLEPEAVHPIQYLETIRDLYGCIITPGEAIYDSDKEKFIGWPFEIQKNPAQPTLEFPKLNSVINSPGFFDKFALENWEKRLNKFHLIAANKVSPTRQSNYQLRRNIAAGVPPEFIDVYGPFWNDGIIKKVLHRLGVFKFALKNRVWINPVSIYGNLFQKYPNYCGKVEDKLETAQNYRFALVIENSNSYTSEKLLDAILAGCICLYVGPPISKTGLPEDVAIQFSGNISQIKDLLTNIDLLKVENQLNSMKEFVASERFLEYWESNSVFSKIAHRLDKYWREN